MIAQKREMTNGLPSSVCPFGMLLLHHVDDSLSVTADQFAKGLPAALLGLGDQFEFSFRWLATRLMTSLAP
jgi:hypothetical protein